jgi:hypothetical protein
MSHVFLPRDPTLKKLAVEIEEERNHALVLETAGEAVAERGERAPESEGFHALWSSAQRDDEVLQTTLPGEAMQLFAEPAPAPSPALAAFGGPIVAEPTVTTTTEPVAAAPAAESSYQRRERLRAERRALVSTLARRTGEEHRVINARINRDTGAPAVAKATAEQLERANALLEREIARRGG